MGKKKQGGKGKGKQSKQDSTSEKAKDTSTAGSSATATRQDVGEQVQKPTEKPVEKPVEKQAVKPSEKPVDEPTEKLVEKLSKISIEKPAHKPVEEPEPEGDWHVVGKRTETPEKSRIQPVSQVQGRGKGRGFAPKVGTSTVVGRGSSLSSSTSTFQELPKSHNVPGTSRSAGQIPPTAKWGKVAGSVQSQTPAGGDSWRSPAAKFTPGIKEKMLSPSEAATLPSSSKQPAPVQPSVRPKVKFEPAIESKVVVKTDSSKGIKPIPRPNYGKVGRRIPLRSNFFPIKINPEVVIYHYDVDMKPEIKSKEKSREIINIFVKGNVMFNGVASGYDGRKSLYTNRPLTSINGNQVTFSVSTEGSRKPVTVGIKYAAQTSLSNLLDYFIRPTEYPQETVQSLDVALREMGNQRCIPLGSFFFSNPLTDARINFDGKPGLQLWSGYYQSVRPGWKCMMLQVDTSVRVFYKGQRVVDLFAEYFNCSLDGLNERPMNENEHRDFGSYIKGLQIEMDTANYPMLMRRSYRLIGLSKNIASVQTFPMAQPDGKEIPTKVAHYYKSQYGIDLSFPVLHCLQAQPADKHRYFPMEVCVVKKGQQLKKLTDTLTSELIKYSAKPAFEREKQINQLVSKVNFSADPIAQAFGMSISNKMIEFDGRVLPPPKIQYDKGIKVDVRDGSWNAQQVKFISSAFVKTMAVLCFDRYMKQPNLQNFITKLIDKAKKLGMSLPAPSRYEFGSTAKDVCNLIKHVCPKDPKDGLIIIVVPSEKRDDLYSAIKVVGDLQLGITTQCVKGPNVNKCQDQTLANICFKINAKLGETNAIINPAEKSSVIESCLVMGADVTHPAPGDKTSPSIAAVTGSLDAEAFTYAARISMQEHRKEIIGDLEEITKALLNNFKKLRHEYPLRIIFYRDGVSEGQFPQVLAEELTAIQRACYAIGPKYQPPITFITVQKRHHTRLFPVNREDARGKSGNVPAGTTVDTDIVHPNDFDFYLCSHQGIQGTSRPAHYYVLYDDSNFDADTIEKLTYHLCHLYARCSRAVSIPAPVYYAHHLAFRGRYYLDWMGREGKLPEANEIGVNSNLNGPNIQLD
ncbi:argonaute 1 [Chamberlinius hualienensis]